MSGSDLNAEIQLALSRGDGRLFRMNSGKAWAGKILECTPERLVLGPYHAVKLGATGFSDLFGWVREDGHAIFTAIEGKYGRDRATAEQLSFLKTVVESGGRAGIARSVDEASAIMYSRPLLR